MSSIGKIDDLISSFDFKRYREAYRWPAGWPREESEKKIGLLENLVRNNIFQRGALTHKEVLLKILHWKTEKRQDSNFSKNDTEKAERKVRKVLELIALKPHEPELCIKEFCSLYGGLDGVGIPVASAFLRFLDPDEHRFGVIDKFVARHFNDFHLTKFILEETGQVRMSRENIDEYKIFQDCLLYIARGLSEKAVTFSTIDGKVSNFSPVDIEMAIFTYRKQSGGYLDH